MAKKGKKVVKKSKKVQKVKLSQHELQDAIYAELAERATDVGKKIHDLLKQSHCELIFHIAGDSLHGYEDGWKVYPKNLPQNKKE